MRRATLSDLVNGNAALFPETALCIEKAFGVSMDTLLRMQAWYDSHTMRQRGDIADLRDQVACYTSHDGRFSLSSSLR